MLTNHILKIYMTISVVMAVLLINNVNIFANELDEKVNVREPKYYQSIQFGSSNAKYEVHPWQMTKIKEFNASYLKVIGNKSNIKWLRELSGPSSDNKLIGTRYGQFVVVNSCKQNECDTNYIYILYNHKSTIVYALLIENRNIVWLGNPDDELKKILLEIKDNNL